MISKNSIYLFLAGFTAGAVVASIYTPYSGADTRKRIQQGVEDAGNSIGEAGTYLRGQADRINAEAQATIAHTRAQVQDVLDQAGSALNATLKQATDTIAANPGQLATAAIKSVLSSASRKI